MKKMLSRLIGLFIFFALTACGRGGGGGESGPAPVQTGTVTLSIALPTLPGKAKGTTPFSAPAPGAINSIRGCASATDIDPPICKLLVRNTDFDANTNPVTFSLEGVPVGTNRTFTAQAYASNDGSGTPLFQGSTTGVTIVPGNNRVDIFLFEPPFSAPTISGFSPLSGCIGATVTITGTNFDPIAANNSVIFLGGPGNADDRRATLTGATPTQLTVTVPNNASAGPIVVNNLVGGTTSAGSFTVSPCNQSALFFTTKLNLSNNAGSSFQPSVAINGQTVLVAWHDNSPGNFDILLARSTDGGANFATPVNLSNNTGISAEPSVAMNGQTVLVAWQDNTPGNYDILLARSTDGGATFATSVNLSNNTGGSFDPSVAINGQTVLVAWEDNTSANVEVFLARSTDGGATFATPVNLSTNTEASAKPSVAMNGQTVLVAWTDNTPGNPEVLLARSTDGGATFATPVNLSNNAGVQDNSSMVAIDGQTVLVAWHDNSPGNYDIFLARSTDGGATFATSVNLSNNTGGSFDPSVAMNGQTVFVAWSDDTPGNFDILLARSP